MKGPLYISDDEKKQGTQEEVQAYEKALNPLAQFSFPYKSLQTHILGPVTTDLLNLMPLIEAVRTRLNRDNPGWRSGLPFIPNDWRDRLLAYEKALGIEQPS